MLRYGTTYADIVAFLAIKYAGFSSEMDSTHPQLHVGSGFLKIDSQKLILCLIENAFHIFSCRNFGKIASNPYEILYKIHP